MSRGPPSAERRRFKFASRRGASRVPNAARDRLCFGVSGKRRFWASRAKIAAVTSASLQITRNLAQVRERIERAASRAGRDSTEITIVAVSKTHPAEKIRELYEGGIRHFGENRVQERQSKAALLADLDITWHMIGRLQKNKAARAASLFHAIDSVDSVALAEKLDRAGAESALPRGESSLNGSDSAQLNHRALKTGLRILVEVKLDPEPAKSGVESEELARVTESILRFPRLDACGLMGVPPYFDNPEQARPYFRRLRELRDALEVQLGSPSKRLPVLSMGMSHDFEIAIEEGATELRIGTALFGERPKP